MHKKWTTLFSSAMNFLMRNSMIVLMMVLMSSFSHADSGVYGYAYWGPKFVNDYLKELDATSPKEGQRSCESMYSRALNKGVLDIRYALGYFDDSTGHDAIWNGINFGMSPSLDVDIFYALRGVLTSRCRGDLRFCGFKESSDPNSGVVVLQKKMKFQGRKILVRLTLSQASASPSFVKNKGSLKDRQAELTARSEENYFGGLRSADIVLYNGHSRNGGGPDFAPPILNSENKVNYKGYYEIKRPGINKVMSALKDNPDKGIIVGLFSCYSHKHFYNTFTKANPNQRLILSADTIDYVDSLKASVGYAEGFLRGMCGEELSSTAKRYDKIRTGFMGYRLN